MNPEVLPVEQPFVIAHEWGHLAGWARESEASYVGWLTCREGDVARALQRMAIALLAPARRSAARPTDARSTSSFRRPAARPGRHCGAIARAQPLLQQASWGTYDQFLKANRVDEA